MKRGRRFQLHGMRCVVVKNEEEHARIGFAISRKYGNSVQRHALKRAFREVFRCHAMKGLPLDLLVIPHQGFDAATNLYQDATDVLNQLMYKYQHLSR